MSTKDYVLIAAALRKGREAVPEATEASAAVDATIVDVCDALQAAHDARDGYKFKRSVFLSAAGHSSPLTG